MITNERVSLHVNSGPLFGQNFNNLIEYLDEMNIVREGCPHEDVEEKRVVSGIFTKQAHVTIATVCRVCNKVLTAERRAISKREARILLKRET